MLRLLPGPVQRFLEVLLRTARSWFSGMILFQIMSFFIIQLSANVLDTLASAGVVFPPSEKSLLYLYPHFCICDCKIYSWIIDNVTPVTQYTCLLMVQVLFCCKDSVTLLCFFVYPKNKELLCDGACALKELNVCAAAHFKAPSWLFAHLGNKRLGLYRTCFRQKQLLLISSWVLSQCRKQWEVQC